ncbi:DUF6907 domain-containing protein [Streptomyces rhizosphaerihabitans]|uniref:DUF6907 domain-containing protein n=1 Tax=Streptomyces rhizosphaerihabitans TaxID=1266770 RepID=UPI0021BEBCCD|nr:hypothetical protein [Streptomyces rhizosphaerihabitans]MCT9009364.1 hypothetical protein [Streptomyces rhizosphaerihabitans]
MPVRSVTVGTIQTTTVACPDGKPHCLGEPLDHSDPREHIHRGPEHSLRGSYLGSGPRAGSILGFSLIQWNDDKPQLEFAADGAWPELDLPQIDELMSDLADYLHKLQAARDQLAQLNGEEPKRFVYPGLDLPASIQETRRRAATRAPVHRNAG